MKFGRWLAALPMLLAFAGCGPGTVTPGNNGSPVTSQPALRDAQAAEEHALEIIRNTGGAFVFGGKDGKPLGIALTGWPDEAMNQLGYIRNLEYLHICSSRTSEAGLAKVARLKMVHRLVLSGPTTDGGLRILQPMTDLESIDLNTAEVTDDGLVALLTFPKLKSVKLWRCPKVTAGGTKRLSERGMKVEQK